MLTIILSICMWMVARTDMDIMLDANDRTLVIVFLEKPGIRAFEAKKCRAKTT